MIRWDSPEAAAFMLPELIPLVNLASDAELGAFFRAQIVQPCSPAASADEVCPYNIELDALGNMVHTLYSVQCDFLRIREKKSKIKAEMRAEEVRAAEELKKRRSEAAKRGWLRRRGLLSMDKQGLDIPSLSCHFNSFFPLTVAPTVVMGRRCGDVASSSLLAEADEGVVQVASDASASSPFILPAAPDTPEVCTSSSLWAPPSAAGGCYPVDNLVDNLVDNFFSRIKACCIFKNMQQGVLRRFAFSCIFQNMQQGVLRRFAFSCIFRNMQQGVLRRFAFSYAVTRGETWATTLFSDNVFCRPP